MTNPKKTKVNMKKFWKNLNKSQNKQNKIIKEIYKNGQYTKKKYELVGIREKTPYNYITGNTDDFKIDRYVIYTDNTVIIDCHINASPNVANKEFVYNCTLPLNIRINFIASIWRESAFYPSEYISDSISWDTNKSTNYFTYKTMTTTPSSWNVHSFRVFGYIE